VTQLKAARGASDFFKSHTDQGPFAITVYVSGYTHTLLERLLSEALAIPGTLVYRYHYGRAHGACRRIILTEQKQIIFQPAPTAK